MSDSGLNDGWQLSPADYLHSRKGTVSPQLSLTSKYVHMSDGCALAVDVYLPVEQMHWQLPTIVIFTPYTRRFWTKELQPDLECSPNTAIYRDSFVKFGYALVVVDMRGTGASFGTRFAFRSPRERQDAYEIADWIVAQPWSNGRIGSTGISYLGAAAAFLASTGHTAVKAVAPLFSISDIYSEQLFPGGMLSKIWSTKYDELMIALDQNDREKIRSFAYFNDERLQGPQPVDEDQDRKLLASALEQHTDNFRLHDMMPELCFRKEGPLSAPELNTDVCSPFHYLKEGIGADVAVYSVSGWYDGGGYANGAISRFLTIRGEKDRLLLGPWDHGARTDISPWRRERQPEFPLMAELLRFFDEHLMGLDTQLSEEAPVHYYCVHEERWKTSTDWPPRVEERRLFLTASRTLEDERPATSTEATYQVKYSLNTGGSTRWARLGAQAVDAYYGDWAERPGQMLNFTSQPFERGLTITGHIVADLWISSSERDFGIFVYASEVETAGTVRYVTEGMLRALHRKVSPAPLNYQTSWPYRTYTRADAELLPVGERCRLLIPLLPISWQLAPGSRLMISVSGSDSLNFPQVAHGRPPRLTFAFGAEYSSAISIPVETSV